MIWCILVIGFIDSRTSFQPQTASFGKNYITRYTIAYNTYLMEVQRTEIVCLRILQNQTAKMHLKLVFDVHKILCLGFDAFQQFDEDYYYVFQRFVF